MRPPGPSWTACRCTVLPRSVSLRIVVAIAAIVLPSAPTPAADGAGEVGPLRAELVHQWDLNKDGTIDESEAEVARAKMRRARRQLEEEAAAGKPLFPDPTRDDSPAGPPRHEALDRRRNNPAEGDPLGEAFRPVKPPAAKPDGERSARDTTGRDRDLNAGRPVNDGRRPPNGPVPREKMGMGGVVSGGVRAGAPAVRPGYGANGPKVDLNAGRLPAGLPPARGMPPQVGSAPFRSGVPASGQGRGRDVRGAAPEPGAVESPRAPLVPSSPTRVTADDFGLP